MRILHVLTAADADAGFGGPLSVALAQASEMRARGHSVEVLSTHLGDAARTDVEGLRTFSARTLISRFSFSGRVSADLNAYLVSRLDDADVVHVHFARDLVPIRALQLASRASVPTVAQPHGMYLYDGRLVSRVADLLAARRALATTRVQIALNRWERNRLIENRVPRDRIRIVPNAAPALDLPDVRSDREHVVFISRLHPRKRVMDFARAAELLIERSYGTGVLFDIYGPDAGDLDYLRAFLHAGSPNLRANLRYHGALPASVVPRVLATAAVFVLPSRDEPFPVALLEAMSAGVPTVCTDSCHIADLIQADDAGMVVRSSVEDIADAIDRLLTDRALAGSVRAGARRLIAKELSAKVVGDKLEAVYREAIDG